MVLKRIRREVLIPILAMSFLGQGAFARADLLDSLWKAAQEALKPAASMSPSAPAPVEDRSTSASSSPSASSSGLSAERTGASRLAEAPSAGSNGFRVSSTRTSDSSVLLEGPVSRGVGSLLVTFARESAGAPAKREPEQELFRVKSAAFSARIYFRSGAGAYEVNVFGCPTPNGGTCSWLSTFRIDNADSRDLSYLLPASDIQSDDPEVQGLSRRITQGAQTELEKSQAIHDWVASNIAYDVDAFYTGLYVNMPWDAVTVLGSRVAICQGYTTLNAALHRAIGIRAKTIVGSAQSINTGSGAGPSGDCNHAWNEILIDGQWRAQDTTWDAGYVDDVSRRFTFSPSRKYFNPEPSEFARTHLKCSEGAN